VNLEAYKAFFADLARAFPVSRAAPSFGNGPVSGMAPAPAPLKVHDVGSFEASFVPSIADFDRLDERFRLPDRLWAALPQYREHGFAVFKLKSTGAGTRNVHPMAFEFPRRDPGTVFFPTVHIHDGEVHPRATFDHVLYLQASAEPGGDWAESAGNLGSSLVGALTEGLVALDRPGYRLPLVGVHDNQDVLAAA
jgi:hypothetical protein